MDFCVEKGLCVGNAYFEHKSLHKCIRVAKGQDGVGLMSMIDLMMVKKYMPRFVQYLRAVRGVGQGLSDYHFIPCKVRFLATWTKRREVVNKLKD